MGIFISICRMCELSVVLNPQYSVLFERQTVQADEKMKCCSGLIKIVKAKCVLVSCQFDVYLRFCLPVINVQGIVGV